MNSEIKSVSTASNKMVSANLFSDKNVDTPNLGDLPNEHISPPITFIDTDVPEYKSLANTKDTYYIQSNDLPFGLSFDDDDQSIDSEQNSGNQSITKDHYNEEEDLTRIKRKAQNRVAQRAFRERKERYVKKLESKIKQIQEDHEQITAQLLKENGELKSIICRLRDHLCKNLGMPVRSPMESKSRLPTDNTLSNVNSLYTTSCATSLKPLQVRPSIISEPLPSLPSTNVPKKQKKRNVTAHINSTSKNGTKKAKRNTKKSTSPSPTDDSCQQIKFSITTPATLRENTFNELARKSEIIPAVQLYPDHQHPANYLRGRKLTNMTHLNTTPTLSPTPNYSSSDSVTSISSDMEEKNTTTREGSPDFDEILKLFLNTHDTISTIENS